MAVARKAPTKLSKALIKRYLTKLEGKEGCNFRHKKGDPKSMTGTYRDLDWNCAGGASKAISTRILKKLGVAPKDIARVHAAADKHGGHCDCEIIFNAKSALLKKSWK